MRKYGTFAVLIALMFGSLLWLAASGMKASQIHFAKRNYAQVH
jgi:hypothetical protein